MVRGRVLRKETYLAQRVEVQRFEIVRICEGRRVWRVRESDGRSGERGGQFGGVVGLGSCLGCLVGFDLAIFWRWILTEFGDVDGDAVAVYCRYARWWSCPGSVWVRVGVTAEQNIPRASMRRGHGYHT